MIYPPQWPLENSNAAEALVYHKLSLLKDKYDIFYAKRFVSTCELEKSEYEIDFIVCIPNLALLCLEVKGGNINYDGISGRWSQNTHSLFPGPDLQASAAAHSLVNRYRDVSQGIPFGWALCFPDCEVAHGVALPTALSAACIIDRNSLLYMNKALESIFTSLFDQYPSKMGCRSWQYNGFRADLLRGLGFVKRIGTTVRHDNERFIQLASDQIGIFRHVIENDKILVHGPAGSGKTIIAVALAQEAAQNGKKVFVTCFNKTLAKKIGFETKNNEHPIHVSHFHSFAKRTIESIDPQWWADASSTSPDFWEIDVPAKLDAVLPPEPQFDYLIIDEGQDFKEFWYEILFRRVKPTGKIIIFLDRMQDIFNRNVEVPNEASFFKYALPDNCRNTKRIVKYLEEIVDTPISTKSNPDGSDVVKREVKNQTELIRTLALDIGELLEKHEISDDQILLILNSEKSISSVSSVSKLCQKELKYLDSSARMEKGNIYYTTINTFKGLEIDIVMILDLQLIDPLEKRKVLYTEASRARHMLYTYEIML
jgi:hypothetical protein